MVEIVAVLVVAAPPQILIKCIKGIDGAMPVGVPASHVRQGVALPFVLWWLVKPIGWRISVGGSVPRKRP